MLHFRRNTGLAKLKGFQLGINVDETVTPVAQPVRKIPFSVRKLAEVKTNELEDMDVIEKVNGSTPWVSPLVVVHKKTGDRVCVGMRRANEAVVQERHPIPTIDEILEDMSGVHIKFVLR